MKNILSKIVDVISIIIYMSIVVLGVIVGFMVLGSILLGLKVVIFDIMFWIKAVLIFIGFIFVVIVGLLAANGYEKIHEWRNNRR